MFGWLESLTNPRRNRPDKTRQPARRLLRLETLEGRCVPATIIWEGGTSTDPTVAANWSTNTVPTANDEVKFNDQAQDKFDLKGLLTVGKLTVESTFAKGFLVEGVFTLQMGAIAGASSWNAHGGVILANANSEFRIKGSNALIFDDGGIGTVTGLGKVKVYDGAQLELQMNTYALKAALTVGDGSTQGTVTVGGLNQDINASGSTILVTSTGTFEMLQTGPSSSSRGGLVQPDNVTPGTFTNQGTFRRVGETTGPYIPQLDFVITNTRTIKVEPNSNIRFTRKDADNYSVINNSTGTVEIHYGSTVTVAAGGKYRQNGGIFQTKGDPTTGAGTVFFYASSEFAGGSFYINRGGTFGSIDFGNNDLTFSESVVIYLKLDGSSPTSNPNGDAIYLTDAATLTIDNSGAQKPKLNLETLNGKPPEDWAFDVMWAPNLVGTFTTTETQGQTPDLGYSVTYPPISPRRVRVTSLGEMEEEEPGDPPPPPPGP